MSVNVLASDPLLFHNPIGLGARFPDDIIGNEFLFTLFNIIYAMAAMLSSVKYLIARRILT